MDPDDTYILGLSVPIRKALWNRILHLGAPRMMTYTWMMGSAWVGLLVFNKWGLRWVLTVLVVWAMGQALLAALTRWNGWFDNALCARWKRSYQSYYPSG